MRRLVLLFVPLLALMPVRADALSVRDIIELTKAHLGEEILLALIEVDRSAFPIDAATIKSLKEAGVTEKVILAMIRSERTPSPALPDNPVTDLDTPVAQEPRVIVIDHHDDSRSREVAVPVPYPVYVPVTRRVHDRQRVVGNSQRVGNGFVVNSVPDLRASPMLPNATSPAQQRQPAKPVYWGTSGKLRPDAWKPGPDGK
jgi:hypothetical protein